MDNSLLVHVLSAFLVGGVGVAAATYAAKRYSSGIGGLIGGLPTISSISFFFIGLNQSIESAYQATTAFPLGMSFTFLFLLIYATVSERGFRVAIGSALLAWFALSGVESYIRLRSLLVSTVAVAVMFVVSMYVYRDRLRLPYSRGAQGSSPRLRFLLYALLGGTVVATAVYLSQVLGTTAGGIAAAVPAIFSMTLTFTYLSDGGMDLSRSMAKPLMMTAMTVAFPYSVIIGFLYPRQGLYLGTIIGMIATIPLAGLAYFLVEKKRV